MAQGFWVRQRFTAAIILHSELRLLAAEVTRLSSTLLWSILESSASDFTP